MREKREGMGNGMSLARAVITALEHAESAEEREEGKATHLLPVEEIRSPLLIEKRMRGWGARVNGFIEPTLHLRWGEIGV